MLFIFNKSYLKNRIYVLYFNMGHFSFGLHNFFFFFLIIIIKIIFKYCKMSPTVFIVISQDLYHLSKRNLSLIVSGIFLYLQIV